MGVHAHRHASAGICVHVHVLQVCSCDSHICSLSTSNVDDDFKMFGDHVHVSLYHVFFVKAYLANSFQSDSPSISTASVAAFARQSHFAPTVIDLIVVIEQFSVVHIQIAGNKKGIS